MAQGLSWDVQPFPRPLKWKRIEWLPRSNGQLNLVSSRLGFLPTWVAAARERAEVGWGLAAAARERAEAGWGLAAAARGCTAGGQLQQAGKVSSAKQPQHITQGLARSRSAEQLRRHMAQHGTACVLHLGGGGEGEGGGGLGLGGGGEGLQST